MKNAALDLGSPGVGVDREGHGLEVPPETVVLPACGNGTE